MLLVSSCQNNTNKNKYMCNIYIYCMCVGVCDVIYIHYIMGKNNNSTCSLSFLFTHKLFS